MSNAVPVVGSDDGTWGTILNQFLSIALDVTTGQLLTGTTNQNYTNFPTLYPTSNWGTNPNYATNSVVGLVQLAGDLAGTAPSPSVVKLQGTPVSATGPSTGQVLQVNSSTWTPVSYGGDVSGKPSASTVVALQGVAVSGSTPSTGNILEYNGSAWAPTANTSGTQRTFAFFAS